MMAAQGARSAMRICLISREFPPDSGWGGIATYSYHHAHSLKKLGHDVEVFSLAAKDAGSDRTGKQIEDGITVHRVQAEQYLDNLGMLRLSTPFTHFVLRSVLSLAKAILKAHQQNPFDVAECPEHLGEGLSPALTRLFPLVVRLHTPQSKFIQERFHNLSPSFDQEFVAMIERLAMLSADVITSPSEDMADYVAGDMAYPRNKIEIIRNPVDINKFSPEGKVALQADENLKVLFVGRLEERKGVHYLIKAVPKIVEKFQKVKFIIIGADTNNARGQKSTLAELQELVREAGCGDRVEFINYVPLAQIPEYYRSADICVVPSLYDNAPCTVLEGMSSARPVITTTSGGSKEYVLDGHSGFVVAPKDEEALATVISKLLLDNEQRKKMGNSARERIIEHFHPEKLAQETVDVYKLAIDRFAQRNAPSIYCRPAEKFMEDTENLLAAYNRMLYDFLYANSWRFRLKHRVSRATSIISKKLSP